MRSGFKNNPLRRRRGQGASWLLCTWRQGSSPDRAHAFSVKGHLNVRQWEAKSCQCIKGFASLGSRGIKGREEGTSWIKLRLFQIAQSSEELWSIRKNKKEDPGYSFSLLMLVTRLVDLYPERKAPRAMAASCHIPDHLPITLSNYCTKSLPFGLFISPSFRFLQPVLLKAIGLGNITFIIWYKKDMTGPCCKMPSA